MQKLLPLLIGIPATAFAFLGLSWFVSPTFAAEALDMALLDGRGLGTQVADLGSFFLTLGICMLLGVFTRNPIWCYSAMMLMAIASVGRVLAWLAHGAALTLDMIAVEVVLVSLLYVASRRFNTSAT
ncbi:MAG: hypothetical protein AAFZ65_07155 [Planctomycetota bacterium]